MARKIESRNKALGIRVTPTADGQLRDLVKQFQMGVNEVIDRLLTSELTKLGELLVESVASPAVEVAGMGNPQWTKRGGSKAAAAAGRKGAKARIARKGGRNGKA